jgi:hypothetical protein
MALRLGTWNHLWIPKTSSARYLAVTGGALRSKRSMTGCPRIALKASECAVVAVTLAGMVRRASAAGARLK